MMTDQEDKVVQLREGDQLARILIEEIKAIFREREGVETTTFIVGVLEYVKKEIMESDDGN